MGAKKNVTMDASEDKVKIVSAEKATSETVEKKPKGKKIVTKTNPRSQKYRDMKALVDRKKYYSVLDAINLVKKTSYANFVATINADLVLKEVDNQINISFPHSTGKTLKVEIVTDDLLQDISAGKLDFDILLTEPNFMPKLAKLARILGPKGLMPNPKNGTIVNDPVKAKKELLSGKTVLKTERKAPLLHVSLGKADMPSEQLAENFNALLKVLSGKAIKATLSATMSPGVKVDLSDHQ